MVARCIKGKAEAGKVDEDRAARLADLYDEEAAALRHANAPNPEATAAARVVAAERATKARKKRARLQTMKAQAQLRARIADNEDPMGAALATLDFDADRKQVGENVVAVQNAVRQQAWARIGAFVETFGSKAAGLDVALPAARKKRKAGLRDVVRELFGEDSRNPEAANAARGAAEGMEYLRLLFNAQGGSIPKRKNWGLPQTHSRRLVNSVSRAEWVEFTQARLKAEDMIDLETGLAFTPGKLGRVLEDLYDEIVTDGLTNVRPSFQRGTNLTTKRAQSRFLVFRDADTWLEYQDRFGEGNAFDTIMAHVNGMSRDIALLRIYGPSPEASLKFVEALVGEARGKQALGKTGKAGARAAGRVTEGGHKLRNLYNTVTGQIYVPGNSTWANVDAANRNMLVSSMLGGAWFSALSDTVFTGITRRINGLPAAKGIAQLARLLNPASNADRQLAARLGFINELALGSAIGQARYVGEVVGPEWSRKFADVVLRATFLSPWTNWKSTAFGMEFLGFVTEHVGSKLSNLPDPLQRSFRAYGITQADWDLMRAVPLFRDERTGATFLRPEDIIGSVAEAGPLFDRHFTAAVKLQQMINTEAEFAVPKVSARTQSLVTFGQQPGTFAGSIARNTFLFRSFPITLVMTHLRRAVSGDFTAREKAFYWAHLIIGTAIMGTFGEQLSQIAKGRDPLPLDPSSEAGRRAWIKGLSRGGGLGIFGDFIYQSENRFGGGFASTAAGPVFGTQLPQFLNLTAGNLLETLKEGEPANVGREFTRFLRLMTPGRSAWYLTQAWDRYFFDIIQEQLDPNYRASFSAMERRARTEFDQRFYAPPGGRGPERAPDLSRMFK